LHFAWSDLISVCVKQTRTVEVQRWREDDDALAAVDEVALEEPLELRVDGFPVAVLMRTPGHDEDLTRGFLLSERIVDDWNAVRHIEVRPAENRSLVFLEDGFGIPGA
jgi:formate dehydrogenase assembly factor FdhD